MSDPINPKKEYLAGLTGMGGGPAGLAFGGGVAAEKIYLEDVFSDYLYIGNATAGKTITNGIDLSEGGFIWTKNRGGFDHRIFDTEMGVGKYLRTNDDADEEEDADSITAFNSNGFTLGSSSAANMSTSKYASWTWKKQEGLLDIVEYTGTSGAMTVNHNLGSVPGFIMIKKYEDSTSWRGWHREMSLYDDGYLSWQNTDKEEPGSTNGSEPSMWGFTKPTATQFTVGEYNNQNQGKYRAYLFAGGESPDATARSVSFGTSSNWLDISDSSDWDLGQTFTIEAWIKINDMSSYSTVIRQYQGTASGTGWFMRAKADGAMQFYDYTDAADQVTSDADEVPVGQWTHIALVNNSGTAQWYINGMASGSSKSFNAQGGANGDVNIGSAEGSGDLDGSISNLRVVKGSAVYTSTFTPPTEPLTNITNTVLLCCNNSSVTGSTVTPGTIGVNSGYVGSPTASTDSPFDDPAGFIFGEDRDQPVIKCGSWRGDGSNTDVPIYMGFEPQWILVKNITTTGGGWALFDDMRGWRSLQNDVRLEADNSDGEYSGFNFSDLTATGITTGTTTSGWNSADTFAYIAIRRPDKGVSKTVEAGTDVFAMDTGGSSTDMDPPNFDAPFAVDMAIYKEINSYSNWFSGSRILGTERMKPDQTSIWSNESDVTWDSNAGWSSLNADSDWMSWMWKRAPGFFDVVVGNHPGYANGIRHGLGVVPGMVWIKNNTDSQWSVYHKDLNGGTNPEQYRLKLNANDAQQDTTIIFDDRAPTATEFFLGAGHANIDCVVYLFASVDGVSKLGSYEGEGGGASMPSVTVTTGFSPRFILIKAYDSSEDWYMLDTVRGISSGNDSYLKLNDPGAAVTANDFLDLTSDGFIVDSNANFNNDGTNYIYYAIA